MPKKLLLLADLDDTLTDRQGAFDAWASSFLSSFGRSTDAMETLRRIDRRGQCDRRTFLALTAEALSLSINVDQELSRYRSATVSVRPCEGVPEMLGRIREIGGSTIVVSNGIGHVQRAKLVQSGLMPMIGGVVVSDEVGVEKPDPAIFELAVGLVDKPTEPWMVGDSFELDIIGAKRAHLPTAWVSHGESPPSHVPVPDITCRTTADCLAAIVRHHRLSASQVTG